MNIVYLHQYFKTPFQPGGTRSYEFARRLVQRGHTVHMVTSIRQPQGSQRGWQESTVAGIHVHAIPVPYGNVMSYRQRIAAFLRFAYHAAGSAARLAPDIVFATSTPLTIALPGAYVAWRCRVPMVFEVRDLWPEMPIALGVIRGKVPIAAARWLERFAYRNAARVIALSPGMRDGVVASGYPSERVSVIPNSCDLDLFTVPSASAQAFRSTLPVANGCALVTYAGSLGTLNGVGYLAQIAAEYRKLDAKEASFLVVGDGRERSSIEALASELGVLNSSFHILGQLPKAEIPLLLSATDVATSLFIDLPEMRKNSANKFFDALASGTPIAINYEGWQADLLRKSGAGLVLPADDPPAAAQLLATFLADRDRLAQAGQAARHLAETRFSRDLLSKEFERVLLLAAEEGRRP
jgi:glycosyltransferase involved in cell wall biosynthesis